MIRPSIIVAGLVLLLAGCALPGADGPVQSAQTGGIGGTGGPQLSQLGDDRKPSGGIGGTGSALTGMFGTITGFGSILINDQVVELGPALSAAARSMGVGSTVLVEAAGTGGGLTAVRLSEFHPIEGVVEAVADDFTSLEIMGVQVDLAEDIIVEDRVGRLVSAGSIKPGAAVAVSGLWRSGRVDAGKLRLLPADAPARLRGQLAAGAGSIAGVAVDFYCCVVPPGPVFADLAGVYVAGRFEAREGRFGLEALFSGAVGRLIFEGYLAPNGDDPGVHLSGFGLPAVTADIALEVDRRAIFTGALTDRFIIEDAAYDAE